MTKKALSVILSALMSVTAFQTPIVAEGGETAGETPEITEGQETETTEAIGEEIAEPEEETENLEEPKEEVKKQPITVNEEAVLNVTQQEQSTSNDKEVIIKEATNEFTQGLQSKVTKQDREVLARMLYGEAGRGADPFEILHTVLNRASSPLFKGSITDIVLQKNQYVGYSPDLPLTNDYLTMVDMAIADWEANNCQKIDGCNHYYFVTGIPGVCNKFEISPENNNGRWVPKSLKKYAKLQEYCPVATEQAERFFTARDGQKPESMTK